MEHFGIKLIDRGKGFNLTKDRFAIVDTKPSLPYFASLAKENAYIDEQGSAYTEAWCEEYRKLCLKNYDLNMKYFALLDKDEFDRSLDVFLDSYKHFVEVENLNKFAEAEGYYVMVLDEYKQVYIGKTKNIKRRIMQHWANTKSFDRTLFPMYAWDKSVFSIDFFRALDTTRIFVWKRKLSDFVEAELVANFPSRFCTNRLAGDVTDGLRALIAPINKRELI